MSITVADLPKQKKVVHRCVSCGKEYPHSFTTFCSCGSMIEVEHDLEHAKIYDSPNPYIRYFDLMPLEKSASILPINQAPTPTIHAKRLGKLLGLPWLYLKNDGVLPTRSTKDRMAISVHSFLREVGVHEFSTSSTGNSSSALAHYAKYHPECRVYLFAGEDFLDRVNFQESDQVIVLALRGSTFVEAFDEAANFAKRRGVISERGFFNPARREGLKTAFFEAAEAIPRPIDWYVQAVSSAMGVYGTFKGAKELLALGIIRRLPRLLCVQQETCNPLAHAWQDGAEAIGPQHVVKRPTGIASAILRGDPTRVYPHVRASVLASEGTIDQVSEQQIREAQKMVVEYEGLHPCFTASVAVAGLIQRARAGQIPVEHTVLINLTGADRENARAPKNVHWLERTDKGWKPEDSRDAVAQELYS